MPFGNDPLEDVFIMSYGADFTHEIELDPDDHIPSGTVITMRIYPQHQRRGTPIAEWVATYNAQLISWRVESEDSDEIPNRSWVRIYVSYPDEPETLEHCWYIGPVVRKE